MFDPGDAELLPSEGKNPQRNIRTGDLLPADCGVAVTTVSTEPPQGSVNKHRGQENSLIAMMLGVIFGAPPL